MPRSRAVPERLPLVRASCTASRLNSALWILRVVMMVPPLVGAYLHLRKIGSTSKRSSPDSQWLQSNPFESRLVTMNQSV